MNNKPVELTIVQKTIKSFIRLRRIPKFCILLLDFCIFKLISNQFELKMSNEPNLCETNTILSNEPNPVLSEVEWISQITHFINEQRTKNNEQFSNEPNFKNTKMNVTSLSKMVCANFHPIHHQKNKPNLNQILPAVAYLAKADCGKTNNEQ